MCVCVCALEDGKECHATYSVPGSGGACGQRGVCRFRAKNEQVVQMLPVVFGFWVKRRSLAGGKAGGTHSTLSRKQIEKVLNVFSPSFWIHFK